MKKKIVIESLKTGKKEKKEITTTIPMKSESVISGNDVVVIVLKDYKGMLDELYEGDIIVVPERRYKSLAFRGLVKIYEGNKKPNKRR